MVMTLKAIPEGSKLRQDVYSECGVILAYAGDIITEELKSIFKESGIKKLQVDIGLDKFILKKASLKRISNILYGMILNIPTNGMIKLTHMFAIDMAYSTVGELLTELKEYHLGTYNHSLKVAQFSMLIGSIEKVNLDAMKNLCIGGLMHDIGKLKTPIEVLSKTGRLTPEEFELIKKHPMDGAKIAIEFGITNPNVLDIITQHHEKWDGMGYPRALKPRATSKLANICHIADVYCALNEKRDYKDKLGREKLWAIMDDMAKRHFDPNLYKKVRWNIPMYFTGESIYFKDGTSATVIGECDGSGNPRVSYNGRIMWLQEINKEK